MARSLRFRLTFAFAAMVALILAVGITSAVIHRGIQRQVSLLRPASGLDLMRVDLERTGLEVEGYWDPSAGFVATDVEAIAGIRRPKLRGALQAVGDGTITLFGMPIRTDQRLDIAEGETRDEALAALRPGHQVEVTCDVVDGVWIARKLETRDVKASDKIKGIATGWKSGRKGYESLDFHGLHVTLAFDREDAPESALSHLRRATQILTTLQECRAGAYELVGRSDEPANGPGGLGGPAATGSEMRSDPHAANADSALPCEERLDRARSDLIQQMSRSDDAAGPPNRWLRQTTELLPQFIAHLDQICALAHTQPAGARAYLTAELEPFLDEELIPHVNAYLSQAREELGDQLRTMSQRAGATSRIALATSAVAALLALVLGFLVWRSVQRPIEALHEAAKRLGAGQLDTRVVIDSDDELADLARAFNRMAGQLASSMVSMENLENVLDSMAGALFLLGPGQTLTHVNRAGLELLGYQREELIGRPFAVIDRSGDPLSSRAERDLLRKGGSTVPVSFSAAELRAGGEAAHGWVCVAQDLTDRKAIEEQVRRSLQEKELLLREVHHRVKNNMQVISSMLAMQASHATDPRVIAGFEQSQARIRSMALIHEQLYQSTDLASIDVRVYLELLTHHLQRSFGGDDRVRVELELEDLALDLDQSLACGLIVNEVVSNAYQHAFTDGRSGAIRVELRGLAEDRVRLCISDDGRGLEGPVVPERSDTLGLKLVETLGRQLGGEVSFDGKNGLTVSLVFARSGARRAAS